MVSELPTPADIGLVVRGAVADPRQPRHGLGSARPEAVTPRATAGPRLVLASLFERWSRQAVVGRAFDELSSEAD